MDYLRYYWLREDYLFSTVCPRFHRDGSLSAFDFFSIVIWKANRAKSTIAVGLLEGSHTDLDKAVRALTQDIHAARDHEERLKILMDRPGIALPDGHSDPDRALPGAEPVNDNGTLYGIN